MPEDRIRVLQDWQHFILRESDVLKEDPSLLFQQAANQPEGAAPARAAADILAKGLFTRPWFRWVNKFDVAGPLVMTLTGHANSLVSCAFASGDTSVWTADFDGDVRAWDLETGRETRRFSVGTTGLAACSFSPRGDRLAVCLMQFQAARKIELWNAETGELVAALPGHQLGPFSPDGAVVATGAGREIRVARADSGEIVSAMAGHTGRVMSCAFSPDSRRLVSASDDNTLKVWDVASGRGLATLSGHTWTVRSGVFSPDGTAIASVGDDETIRLWDAETGSPRLSVKGYSKYLKACAFAGRGRILAGPSGENSLSLWDASSGRAIFSLEGPVEPIRAIAVSPDGALVAAGAEDKTVTIWSAAGGERIAVLAGHDRSVESCAFSASGRLLISSSFDGTAKVWRADKAATGAGERHASSIRACRFAPDGASAVTASSDATLKVWDSAAGALKATLAGHEAAVNACDISPNGRLVVSMAQSGAPRVWDLRSFRTIGKFREHEYGGRKCCFSPDGLRVVTVDFDSRLMLWDPFTGRKYAGLKSKSTDMRDFAFTPDGAALVASLRETVEILDGRTGRPVSKRQVLEYPRQGVVPDVRCLVSPMGDRVAVLDRAANKTYAVYQLPDWNETPLRDVQPSEIAGLWMGESTAAFSMDGRVLAVPGYQSLFVWEAGSGELIAALDYANGTLGNVVIRHFAMSDDSSRIACKGLDKVLLWDLPGRKLVRVLDVRPAGVTRLFFSPDCAWVVAATERGLLFWDAGTGAPASGFYPGTRINELAWSPDGTRLAAGTENGSFYLLEPTNMRLGRPLAFAWIGPPGRRSLFRRTAAPAAGAVDVRCPVCRQWFERPEDVLGAETDCSSCGRRLRISARAFRADKRRPGALS